MVVGPIPVVIGVVPAAGRGTRLEELTDDRSKGLVEVGGQPLLAHVFETLIASGVGEVVVVVGYRAGQILEHFGDSFQGVPITCVHQREQLGLGHAVLQAAPYVEGPFVVLNGDNVLAGDLRGAIERMGGAGVDAAVAVEQVDWERAKETGVVSVADEADGGPGNRYRREAHGTAIDARDDGLSRAAGRDLRRGGIMPALRSRRVRVTRCDRRVGTCRGARRGGRVGP